MRILCVHQGFELYGSDRAFIDSVRAIRAAWPNADIEVLIPCDGPIAAPLRQIASRVVIEPILVLRRRDLGRLLATGGFRFVGALWRSLRRYRSADLVYVNTVVVVDYLFAARFFPDKALVHVHEIPEGVTLRLFRMLLRWSRADVIFNSEATRAAYQPLKYGRQHVVYNGVAMPAAVPAATYDGRRPLRLLMIGRINRTKGQEVLIAALARLAPDIAGRLRVRMVGASFGNDVANETTLRDSATAAGLDEIVSFEPFQADPGPLYAWADVVVVPSRRPESLGRVAIEAMAHGRPALVSAIGGLVEVVADGVSGWTVAPGDPAALADKIAEVVTRPESWRSFPAAARSRCETLFASGPIADQIQAIVGERLATAGHGLRRPSDLAPV